MATLAVFNNFEMALNTISLENTSLSLIETNPVDSSVPLLEVLKSTRYHHEVKPLS